MSTFYRLVNRLLKNKDINKKCKLDIFFKFISGEYYYMEQKPEKKAESFCFSSIFKPNKVLQFSQVGSIPLLSINFTIDKYSAE